MDVVETLRDLVVALAIGILIGVERHWRQRDEAAGQRTAGVRSFGVCGLMGGLAAAVAEATARPDLALPVLVGLGLLGLSGALIVFKNREAMAEGSFSVTAVLVGQATFLLGALAVAGDLRVATGAAAALAGVLASRELLHTLVQHLSWEELRAAILLLSMTLVVLPLIPEGDLLWGLNPARIWTFAIILAAVSFVGYAAMRVFGASRGLLLAGAAAGLVSSTAAVVANARKVEAGNERILAGSAVVASGVSYLRTEALAFGLSQEVGRFLLAPLLVAATVQLLLGALALRRQGSDAPSVDTGGNPFELGSVLQFALLLAVLGVAAKQAAERLGTAGTYVVAALSGLADVDAVTLSTTALVPHQIGAATAAMAILIAVVSNTLAKTGYALWFGGARYGLWYGVGVGAALAAGLLAMAVAGGFGEA